MANKYDAPPTYPQNAYTQQHYDAGPYAANQPSQPANADYYGHPPMNTNPQQGYYGQQPAQGMYYQQPPPGAVQGHFVNGRPERRGTERGLCAGLLGALACCCCLDCIF